MIDLDIWIFEYHFIYCEHVNCDSPSLGFFLLKFGASEIFTGKESLLASVAPEGYTKTLWF